MQRVAAVSRAGLVIGVRQSTTIVKEHDADSI